MLRLRKAKLEDLKEALKYIEEWAENELVGKGYSWSEEDIKYLLCEAATLQNWLFAVCADVTDEDEELVGALIAYTASSIFDKEEKRAIAVAWFVRPEWRGSEAGRKLLNAFTQWADNQGCRMIIMSGFTNSERMSHLYQRMGFNLHDTMFTRRI